MKNLTKKTTVSKDHTLLKDMFSKARGLMFARRLDKALVFVFERQRRIDLHMFFVFFAIDVLFLDDKKQVVEMLEGFRPFSVYYSRKPAHYVVELPAGTIKESRTSLGDMIGF